jgi:uncharacterized membrane protein
VLITLEKTARIWHEARENLHTLAVTDPLTAAEIQALLDASMSSAVATAEPVMKRDDQGSKALARMEEDIDLMEQVCGRIRRHDEQMRQWAESTEQNAFDTQSSLRQRIEQAREERAIAEAELDGLIG